MEYVADMITSMDTDCILWHKSYRENGYGQTFFQGKVTKAHRAAWIKAKGEIPEGMVIDHMCGNRGCVNVEHLRVVTQRENIMAGKWNRDNRDACPKGHPNTPENTMVRKNGNRECAECNRVRSRANWAKKAGK
jgi:hypothetical protein